MGSLDRFLLCWAVVGLGLAAFPQTTSNLATRTAGASAENGKGIVVEAVQKDLEAQKAGLKEGDVLLRWVQGSTSREFASPFDLADLEVEQAARGAVTLEGTRGDDKQTWVLGQALWGVDVRPNLPESLLGIYLDGQKLVAADKVSDAAERWRSAAGKAQEPSPRWLASWFLFRAGQTFARAQQWKQADAFYKEAIERTADAGPAIKARMLQSWGATFQQRVDWTNAGKLYQQAADERQKLGPNSLTFADTLDVLGFSLTQRGDLPKAEKYYSQALNIQQKQAPDSLGAAKSWFGEGSLALAHGDLSNAEKDFSQALAIRKKLASGSLDVASTLNALGVVAINRDDLNQADEYYRQALTIRESAAPGSLTVAASLNNLGNLALRRGNLGLAEDYHRQSLSIKEKLAPESLDVAVSLGNLGLIAYERGDLAQAEEYDRHALAIDKKLAAGALAVSDVLAGLADVVRDRGDLKRAEEYYNQALAITEKLAPGGLDEAGTLHALGVAVFYQGDLVRAEAYLRRAYAIREKVGPATPDVAASLYCLGLVAHGRGELAEAEEYHRQALAISQKIAPDGLDVAQALFQLANDVRDRGDLAKAEEYYRQGLAIWENLNAKKKQYVETLASLAEILVHKGELNDAAALFSQAVNVIQDQMGQLGGSEGVRSNFRSQNAGIYRSYVDLLIRQKRPEQALEILERSRAQTLLEMLVQAHVDVHRGADAALLQREHSLQADIGAKADRRIRLKSGPHSEAQLAAISREIEALLAQYSEVEGQIRVSSPNYAALTQPQSLSAKDIQRRLLDSDTVLLEYSLGKERSYLLVVTAESLDSYELPRQAEIEAAARRFYALLAARPAARPSIDSEYSEAAATLGHMVLAPVAAQIKGKRLLIVSDGTLQYVPFAALPEPETIAPNKTIVGMQPLLLEHEIVNAPSASVLAVLRRQRTGRKPAPRAVAVLADPVFAQNDGRVTTAATIPTHYRAITRDLKDDKSEEEVPPSAFSSRTQLSRSIADLGLSPGEPSLPRLRFTRREADAIMAVTPPGAGMKALDFDANRATATSPGLAQYRVVHYATHGLIDGRHPELSGLVLSLVDKDGKPQNGFLTLEDIYNLNLPAELVVLSACQSGLGKDIQGEGLVGLTRGFLYAGATRVLASLWNVDDVATAELMGRFYKATEKDGLSPAAALRRAQIEMWKQKVWRAPYFWAAFQLQGEWK